MPCYLFTFHAYRTWMPDREEGFVRRKQGVLPPDEELARQYETKADENKVFFDSHIQILLIEEAKIACEKQQYRGHSIATDPTHIHILVSWRDERPWLKIRSGLKTSLTLRLNRDVKRRRHWFVDSASRKQVNDRKHFDHLTTVYLPSHRGWKWQEGVELFL
jgi:hypothetical protein